MPPRSMSAPVSANVARQITRGPKAVTDSDTATTLDRSCGTTVAAGATRLSRASRVADKPATGPGEAASGAGDGARTIPQTAAKRKAVSAPAARRKRIRESEGSGSRPPVLNAVARHSPNRAVPALFGWEWHSDDRDPDILGLNKEADSFERTRVGPSAAPSVATAALGPAPRPDSLAAPDDSLRRYLKGPAGAERVDLRESRWLRNAIAIAKHIAATENPADGPGPVDARTAELLGRRSLDELIDVVVPFATEHGAYLLEALARAKLSDKPCVVPADAVKNVPVLPLDRDLDGVYLIVGGHEVVVDDVKMFEVVGSYAGKSFAASRYIVTRTKDHRDTLSSHGWTQDAIDQLMANERVGGTRGRVATKHFMASHRANYPETMLYGVWDEWTEVRAFLLFASNYDTDSAGDFGDEAAAVALREHVGIIGCGSCENYKWRSLTRTAAVALGIELDDTILTRSAHPTQEDHGLEGGGHRDHMTGYLTDGVLVRQPSLLTVDAALTLVG